MEGRKKRKERREGGRKGGIVEKTKGYIFIMLAAFAKSASLCDCPEHRFSGCGVFRSYCL